MIVLSQELVVGLLERYKRGHPIGITFIALDDGDVFVPHNLTDRGGEKYQSVDGVVYLDSGGKTLDVHDLAEDTHIVVIVHLNSASVLTPRTLTCSAMVRENGQFEAHPVQLIPIQEELFSRVKGMYETDVLKNKTVLLIGVGSGGGTIAVEMAKAGVGHFILVDHDRLEIVNVVRHVCGIRDLGRFKTRAVRDLILDKNPFAIVETYEALCDKAWEANLRKLVQQADIVFCGTDNRPSRILVNRVCIEEQRICIYGGTFRRAYGGQVLRVIPGETMCYQCFIDLLPDVATDEEIASEAQAERIAYADRPVAVEPGLSTDIAPMALMCAKIGILEMLRGTSTTLVSLYDDLKAAWFQWLNRREPDSEYADLKPIDSGEDDYRILAWYGITNEKNPTCPACGNFLDKLKYQPDVQQIAAFAAPTDEMAGDELLFPPS